MFTILNKRNEPIRKYNRGTLVLLTLQIELKITSYLLDINVRKRTNLNVLALISNSTNKYETVLFRFTIRIINTSCFVFVNFNFFSKRKFKRGSKYNDSIRK